MWMSILKGIVPPKFIATISKEGTFALSMLTEDTQLVSIDEWSTETMTSDIPARTGYVWGHMLGRYRDAGNLFKESHTAHHVLRVH